MTFEVRPAVFLQTGVGTFPEITEFVAGVQFSTDVFPGRPQVITGSVTLHNHDGRFTPGGTGEFSNYDWMRGSFFIGVNVFEDGIEEDGVYLFDGLVTDIDVDEQSVFESYVTLTFMDALTVAARSSVREPPLPALATTTSGMFRDIVNGLVFDGDLIFPGTKGPHLYAQSPLTIEALPVRGQEIRDIVNNTNAFPRQLFVSFESITDGRVSDAIIETVLPSGPSSIGLTFAFLVIENIPSRPNDGLTTFRFFGTFFERVFTPAKSVATPYAVLSTQRPLPAGASPVVSLDRGMNLKNLINNCQMTMPVLGQSSVFVEVENGVSVAEVGTRNISFTKIADPFNADSGTTEERTDILVSRAGFWAKRFSTQRYDVNEFTVTAGSMVGQATTIDQVFQFLAIARSPFHVVFIDDRPYSVVGTRVSITPTDITVRAEVISGYDLQAFIVGDPILGVIGKMRLG